MKLRFLEMLHFRRHNRPKRLVCYERMLFPNKFDLILVALRFWDQSEAFFFFLVLVETLQISDFQI